MSNLTSIRDQLYKNEDWASKVLSAILCCKRKKTLVCLPALQEKSELQSGRIHILGTEGNVCLPLQRFEFGCGMSLGWSLICKIEFLSKEL